MKLVMENWRSFANEMRDRYLPPGEGPGDPTPEEEERFDRLSQDAEDIVYTAIENPGQLQDVDGSFHILYDPEGEQFLTFNTSEPASLDDYDEIFYRDEEDKVASLIASKLEAGESEYITEVGENFETYNYLQDAITEEGVLVCPQCLFEVLSEASCGCPDLISEAEYRGRKVTLNKPTRGDVKKFKVYVKDPKTGNVKKVNFGHGGSSAKSKGEKTMKIRKSNPKARKSFRARHNCKNPGPKTKARYWSCKKW